MGNQQSQKHIRNEFSKGNQVQHTGSNIYTTSSAAAGFDYPSEDFSEEQDESLHSPSHPKSSHSPSDTYPSFKFPARSDSISFAKEAPQAMQIKKIPVVFKYNNKNVREVFLVGSFTNWKDKILMVKSDGDFMAIVDLPEGEHQFKFVVDGRWEFDPSQPTIDDSFNGKNNVISVKKSDFEVMDALAMDLVQQNQTTSNRYNTDDFSRSPKGEYTDEMPFRGANAIHTDKPPYLPPQLLNIVLNKDTSASCEPALLPEPHHVMLKHLYALSIRDGVMVLSSTFRYRNKFVTTCFYKPI